MANEGSTIILANLNTEELEKSIKKVVDAVENGSKEMAKKFDTSINAMIESMKKLSSLSNDVSTHTEKSTSSRAKETKAVNETVTSYDNLAKAKQKAIEPQHSSARDSYEAMLKGMRESAVWLAKELKNVDNVSLDKQLAEYNKFEAKIEEAKRKVAELKEQLRSGEGGRLVQSQTMNEIARYEQMIKDLTAQQIASTKKIEEEYKQYGTLVKQEYDAMVKKIQEVFIVKQQESKFTEKQISEAKQYTEEINRQVKAWHEMAIAGDKVGQKKIGDSLKLDFYRTMKMPTDSLEQMQKKVERLKVELSSLQDVGLLSPAQIVRAEQEVAKLNSQIAQIATTTQQNTQVQQQYGRTAQEVQEAHARGVQKQIQWQEELKRKTMEAGTVAQKSAREIINAAHAALSQGLSPDAFLNKANLTNGSILRQLTDDIYNMRNAYYSIAKDDRESPLARALKKDMDNAIQARNALNALANTEAGTNIAMAATAQIASATNAQYDALKTTIARLEYEYNKLSEAEKRTEKGQKLAQDIQNAKQKLDTFRESARAASKAANELSNAEEKASSSAKKLSNSHKEATQSNNALTRSFNYMKNRMAFYLTVGATTQFVKQLADIRGQYEMTERSLQILTDSAQKGTEIFNQLSTMALNSPFTAMQLTDAARQLSALGFEADELVGTVKRLGDISAAVGAPIDRISYALGQVQTYGYLTSLQARTFMRMGIPLVKALSEEYSKLEGRIVTTSDVFQRMKDKAISYNDVMRVVNRLTDEGGRFFDYQAKVSETLHVQLSNLSLAWQNMLNDIGKSNQSLLASPIKLLRALFTHWQAISRVVKAGAIAFGIAKIIQLISRMALWTNHQRWAFEKTFGTKMATKMKGFSTGLATMFKSTTFWATIVIGAITDIIMHTNQMSERIKQTNEDIRKNAEETSMKMKDFLDANRDLQESLYTRGEDGKITGTRNLDASEANKAWTEISSQISDSSSNATYFITKLEQIEDVNDRVRKGFDYAKLIQEANGALAELGGNTIKFTQDSWLAGAFGEGLKSDIRDFTGLEKASKSLDNLKKKFQEAYTPANDFLGTLQVMGQALTGSGSLLNAATESLILDPQSAKEAAQKAFAEFEKEAQVTTNSIKDYLDSNFMDFSSKLFNPQNFEDNIMRSMESADAMIKQVAQTEQLTADETFQLHRTINSQLYYQYHMQLQARVASTIGAEHEIAKQQLAIFEETWSLQRVSFQRFLDWMQNSHDSTVRDMYYELTKNGEEAFDLTSREGQAKLNALLESFKQNNLTAYNDLVHWVNLANLLNISIPVILKISADDSKSQYEQLTDLDSKADAAYQKMLRLKQGMDDTRKNVDAALKKQGENSTQYKREKEAYEKKQKEYEEAKKDYEDSVAKGGRSSHAQSDLKKEQSAAERARKQKSKEENKELKAKEKAENEAKRAREKAQREAEQEKRRREQELAKALRDEVSLVEKLRTSYDKLRKEGVAPETITSTLLNNYDATFKDIDKIVKQYGLEGFDFFDFVNPFTNTFVKDNTIFNFFEEQLAVVKNSSFKTRDALKSLEEVLAKMREEGWTKTMEDITKVMGESIDSLSTNYELSLDVEENPELSELFSNMMGIDVSELLKDAPKSLKEFTDEVNTIVGGAMNAYLVNIGNKDTFENFMSIRSGEDFNILDETQFKRLREILTEDSQLFKDIEKLRDDLIKKNRKFFDDAQKTFDDYLSKYGKYADKVCEIEEKRIKDTQTLDNAYYSDELKKTEDYARKKQAIERMTQKELQKLSFEEFKDSEWYITMFGDLDNMSMTTLDVLIGKLQEMKDTMKELDPQNLKTIQTEIDKIMTIRAKKSPIKNFVNDIKEYNRLAKQRKKLEKDLVVSQQNVDNQKMVVDLASKQVKEAKRKYGVNSEEYKIAQNNLKVQQDILDAQKKENESLVKKLKRYGSLKKLLKEEADAVQDFLDTISKYAQLFGDFLESIGDNSVLEDTTRKLSDLVGVAQSAVEGFKTGGVWGAVITGALSLGTTISKWFSGDGSIDKELQRSELRVKQLEMAYSNLEESVNDAYGTMVVGLQKAQIENKKLQLVEMKRQLRLEQGRKKKNQDKGKIEDLKSQINDLNNELANSTETIVNEMLGISGVAGFAEDLVSSMISAFKEGEDYMDVFNEKWDDMIDHMIMKLIVGKVIGDYFNDLFKQMEGFVEERTRKEANEYSNLVAARDAGASTMSNSKLREFLITQRAQNLGYTNHKDWFKQDKKGYGEFFKSLSDDYLNNYRKSLNENIAIAERNLKEASDVATYESYELLANSREGAEERVKMLKDILAQYGIKFGEGTNKELSQLQQGIQGITEDTAGSLESYMNGVSQQVYLQSDLLTQIRDIMVGYDFTLQSATNAEILLSLQQSYQVQMAIQSILVGWSNASGQAVRVEMI